MINIKYIQTLADCAVLIHYSGQTVLVVVTVSVVVMHLGMGGHTGGQMKGGQVGEVVGVAVGM